MRPSRDGWGLGIALVTATRSTCARRNVGAVLVDAAGRVLATGYNGRPRGWPHCNEIYFDEGDRPITLRCEGADSPPGTNLDECEAIHAEQNALLQCPDTDVIHTCYTTASPCVTCAKLLLNTSCERIVFLEEYPAPKARELWEKSGREWLRLSLLDLPNLFVPAE